MIQGDVDVRVGELDIGRGHEVFPGQRVDQFQDPLVQHIPRTDLLFDHIVAGLGHIHAAHHLLSSNLKARQD